MSGAFCVLDVYFVSLQILFRLINSCGMWEKQDEWLFFYKNIPFFTDCQIFIAAYFLRMWEKQDGKRY
jgi:hypothetical protein